MCLGGQYFKKVAQLHEQYGLRSCRSSLGLINYSQQRSQAPLCASHLMRSIGMIRNS